MASDLAAGGNSAHGRGAMDGERDGGRVGAGIVISKDDLVELDAEVECDVVAAEVLEAVDVGDVLASTGELFAFPKGMFV